MTILFSHLLQLLCTGDLNSLIGPNEASVLMVRRAGKVVTKADDARKEKPQAIQFHTPGFQEKKVR